MTLFIGSHGGYYELKEPFLSDNFSVPYYIHNREVFVPTTKYIEKEMSNYVDDNLPICINKFEDLKNEGFEIEYTVKDIITDISDDSPSIMIKMPVTIKNANTINKFRNFEIGDDIAIDLNQKYELSKEIINLIGKDSNKLCLSCLLKIAQENNVQVEIIKYLDTSFIFIITDEINPNFNLTFAVKFDDINCDKLDIITSPVFIEQCNEIGDDEDDPKIGDIPDLKAKVNERFEYRIEADGNNLVFEDYSELFKISKEGVFSFIPNIGQIGNHSIWISAENIQGRQKFKNFRLDVSG